MIIPEDGSLPQITRKGFAAFNNVMLIKVPEKLKKSGETSFQLATLDRSKRGERWPADQYVDIVMNTKFRKETSSAEKSSDSKDDNIQKGAVRKRGKFQPKKCEPSSKNFIGFSKKNQNQEPNCSIPPVVPTDTTNLNPHYMPNAIHDSQVPHSGLHGEKSFQYNKNNFNDNAHTYRYHADEFSSDYQRFGGLRDSLHGDGSSFNHLENSYGAQAKTVNATVSREPTIRSRLYNDFDSPDPPNNQHNLIISPTKPPFVDFQRNAPPYPGGCVINPYENNFNRADISNLNFVDRGRSAEQPFNQNIPNAYSTNNYPIELPRNGNFENGTFPFNPSNRSEFINNDNFDMPPYHNSLETGLNNGFNNNNPKDNFSNNTRNNLPLLPSPFLPPPALPPPALPPPAPYDNFNNIPNRNFQNNFNGRNPRYDQEGWDDRNRHNLHYHRKTGNGRMHRPWRGKGGNKFSRGNNNRRQNNRYQRKKSS